MMLERKAIEKALRRLYERYTNPFNVQRTSLFDISIYKSEEECLLEEIGRLQRLLKCLPVDYN